MFIFFDPLYILLSILGYVILFVIASYIAPKLASRIAGKLSLYTSMLVLAFTILFVSSALIYFAMIFVDVYIDLQLLIIFVLSVNLLTYLISPYMINAFYSAKHDIELQEIVDEVAKKLKMKKKFKAMSVKTPPNAFAYGNFISGKFIAVSESLKNAVTRDELEAIIGHEIGHHKHKDAAITLIFGVIPSIIYYLGYAMIRSSIFDREERRKNLSIIGFLLVIASFVVQILVLAFSRLREYYADYEGAKATNKKAMQSALVRIHKFYYENPRALSAVRSDKFRMLFIYSLLEAIANPYISADEIERIKNSEVSSIQEFLSTHPPIPKRLRFLDSLKI